MPTVRDTPPSFYRALAAISGGMDRTTARELAGSVLAGAVIYRAGDRALAKIRVAVGDLLHELALLNPDEAERIAGALNQALGDAEDLLCSVGVEGDETMERSEG